MQPVMTLHGFAILGAVLANMVMGFLWYGPFFGKLWAHEMKKPESFKPEPSVMVKAMVMQAIGTLLMVYVLAHNVNVWRASSWGLAPDLSDSAYGFWCPFFIWVGFFIPPLLGQVAWEGKSWKLFGINASYHLVNLILAGMILSFWR